MSVLHVDGDVRKIIAGEKNRIMSSHETSNSPFLFLPATVFTQSFSFNTGLYRVCSSNMVRSTGTMKNKKELGAFIEI